MATRRQYRPYRVSREERLAFRLKKDAVKEITVTEAKLKNLKPHERTSVAVMFGGRPVEKQEAAVSWQERQSMERVWR